jgi:uncharacterized protein
LNPSRGGVLLAQVAGESRRGVSDGSQVEPYTDAQGRYRFRLKAANGEIIAVGEAYESKPSALKGIDSVRRNATEAELVDQT